MLMVLHGEPGTGKSVVINALQTMLRKLGLHSTCRVGAFTGKAATLIDGRTLHQWVSKEAAQAEVTVCDESTDTFNDAIHFLKE